MSMWSSHCQPQVCQWLKLVQPHLRVMGRITATHAWCSGDDIPSWWRFSAPSACRWMVFSIQNDHYSGPIGAPLASRSTGKTQVLLVGTPRFYSNVKKTVEASVAKNRIVEPCRKVGVTRFEGIRGQSLVRSMGWIKKHQKTRWVEPFFLW